MRTKKRTRVSTRLLGLFFCAAALTAGIVVSMRFERTSRGVPERRAPEPFVPGLAKTDVAPSVPPSLERTFPAASEPSVAGDRRSASSKPPRNAAAPKTAPVDLSAYRPQARSAQGESWLPRDRSVSAQGLEGHVASRPASDDVGYGVLGDVVRGARRVLKSVDDATLAASRRALGGIARPEEAKIRPYGDGARLHIDIPAHTVDLRRKK